jgi:hypothetical protein
VPVEVVEGVLVQRAVELPFGVLEAPEPLCRHAVTWGPAHYSVTGEVCACVLCVRVWAAGSLGTDRESPYTKLREADMVSACCTARRTGAGAVWTGIELRALCYSLLHQQYLVSILRIVCNACGPPIV